jgi:hypothetical protein
VTIPNGVNPRGRLYRSVDAAGPCARASGHALPPPNGGPRGGARRAWGVLAPPPMPASCSAAPRYAPRTPETSILYLTVQAHLEQFLAQTAGQDGGPGLPEFVKREFEAYLRCGLLAHG